MENGDFLEHFQREVFLEHQLFSTAHSDCYFQKFVFHIDQLEGQLVTPLVPLLSLDQVLLPIAEVQVVQVELEGVSDGVRALEGNEELGLWVDFEFLGEGEFPSSLGRHSERKGLGLGVDAEEEEEIYC